MQSNEEQEKSDPFVFLTIEDNHVIMMQSNMSSEMEVVAFLRTVVRQMEQQIDRKLIL